MRTKLALVACKDAAEGPWIRARGNETHARVSGLGKGERIVLLFEVQGITKLLHLDGNGTYPLPEEWQRLRCKKLAGEEILATNVELVVNG